jgi:hypothetical protein
VSRGMSISAADEKMFVLGEEIIDHINSFFPPADSIHEKTIHACAALRALINVIGIVLGETHDTSERVELLGLASIYTALADYVDRRHEPGTAHRSDQDYDMQKNS